MIFLNPISVSLTDMKSRMKKLYSEKQLIRKTIRLTTSISISNPEIYKSLDETPLFLCIDISTETLPTELEDYLDTLENIVMHSA